LNTKKIDIIIYLTLAVCVILATVFAFYDMEISKQIVNRNSGWAKFLENYGMIPGLLVILSGIYIYYSAIKQNSGAWSYVQKVVFFLANTGLIIYLFDIIISNTVSEYFLINHLITFLIIAFAINIIIFILLQIKKPVQNTITINFARIVVWMALFGYVICIQIVKWFWGRVRFRELDAAFSQFTPWYLPQGTTGYDSFPSGHAAMGWILLALLILFTNKKPWIKYLVFALIFLYAVVLALSRVIVGAHYASDVLFGSFFIIITFLYFSKK
jgi:membrane-associated phospholipid phosphatase